MLLLRSGVVETEMIGQESLRITLIVALAVLVMSPAYAQFTQTEMQILLADGDDTAGEIYWTRFEIGKSYPLELFQPGD